MNLNAEIKRRATLHNSSPKVGDRIIYSRLPRDDIQTTISTEQENICFVVQNGKIA